MHSSHPASRSLADGPSPVRRVRWWVVFGVPTLLLAILFWTVQESPPVTAAETDTYVCPGQYTSIQAAVNDTAPGGTVHICTGTYDESVDLSTMNEDSGEGDITLLAEDGPGTVLIAPASGDAIYFSDVEFVGNINIIGLNVTAANNDSSGINLYSGVVRGAVLISDVVANGSYDGGIEIDAQGEVTVYRTTANDNGGYGLYISSESLDEFDTEWADVTLEQVTANLNPYGGAYIEAAGNVTILNSQADQNGEDGYGDGFVVITPYFEGCAETLPQVSFHNVTANENLGSGIVAFSSGRDVVVDASQTLTNGQDGVSVMFGYSSCYAGAVTVTDSIADDNGQGSENGFGWSGSGFRLSGEDQIRVAASHANGNTGSGFCLINWWPESDVPGNSEDVLIGGVTAEANGQDGVTYGWDCVGSSGPAATLTADMAARGDQLSIMQDEAVPDTPQFVITNTTVAGNAANGIQARYEIIWTEVGPQLYMAPMTVTNASALTNGIHGILISVDLTQLEGEFGIAEFPATVISSSLIMGNQELGVAFETIGFLQGSGVYAADNGDATSFVNGNIICQNDIGGLGINDLDELLPALTLNGQGNWWGDASGPEHPDNLTPGTGDAVLDGSNGGSGFVEFAPWIDRIAASASVSPTVLNVSTDLSFVFDAEAAPAFFLGEGVGNLNDPPIFHVATDNGTLDGAYPAVSGAAIDQFIRKGDGTVLAGLLPASTGEAQVTLEGPCGLLGTLVVPVAEPAVAIGKTPDVQAVTSGSAAQFTIQVTNTGDITLTAISVADAAAPGCARPEGGLADLGPGLSTDYTCSVVVNDDLVNTAEVTAYALILGEPGGEPVTAGDSAAVQVPKISLSKTVGTDPAVCAGTDTITVPQGTTVYYCYTVKNEGSVAVDLHSLQDSELGALFTGIGYSLAPGASFNTVSGGLTFAATPLATTTNVATWTASVGDAAATATDSATVNVLPVGISLRKTVGTEPNVCATTDTISVPLGTTVYFCYRVTNTGGAALTVHSLVDDKAGSLLRDAAYVLEPGESVHNLALGTIVMDTPQVTTTNVATWTASAGPAVATATASATVNVLPVGISLRKTVGTEPGVCATTDTIRVPQGTTVYYCYTVTNEGDATVNLHSLVDDRLGNLLSEASLELAPGESATNLDFGTEVAAAVQVTTTNVATWTARTGDGVATATASATVNVPPLALSLRKTVGVEPGVCATTDTVSVPEGATVYYCYTVTNTGPFAVNLHRLEDSRQGVLLNDAARLLAPGASVTNLDFEKVVTATLQVTTTNVATWTASAGPAVVRATDRARVNVLPLGISLSKTVGKYGGTPTCPKNGVVKVTAGDTVEYCYTVTNTGAYPLAVHSLVDDRLGELWSDVTLVLGPGQSANNLDFDKVVTATLQVTTTNVATWTAGVGPIEDVAAAQLTVSAVSAVGAATVNVEPVPTALDPTTQPGRRRIFLPAIPD